MHIVSILDFPLIGLRLNAPFGEADVLGLETRMRELLTGCEGAVFCSDLRGIGVLSPTTADALLALLREDNRAVAKAAIFVGEDATFSLQMRRIVNSAGHPGRQVFARVEDGVEWLVGGLEPRLRSAVEQFLKYEDKTS
ncbi:MAG: hypothetical protein AAFP04_08260 [Myxococcota bacterium]